MHIGLDLDGVVADFATKANEWLARRAGTPQYPVDRWDWFKQYPHGDALWDQLWNHAADEDLFLSLQPFGGAKLIIKLLREDHDLSFITFRPEWAKGQTAQWLVMHGFAGIPVYFTQQKGEVPWNVLLEDHGPTVAELVQQGRQAVLFRRPWNTEFWNRVPDVDNWYGFKNLLKYGAVA